MVQQRGPLQKSRRRCIVARAAPHPLEKPERTLFNYSTYSRFIQFSAVVSSDRTNLSPFTKDYRGLAI